MDFDQPMVRDRKLGGWLCKIREKSSQKCRCFGQRGELEETTQPRAKTPCVASCGSTGKQTVLYYRVWRGVKRNSAGLPFCQAQMSGQSFLSRPNAFCQGQTFFADRSAKVILLLLRSNRKSKKIRRTILIISTFSVTNRSFP